MDKYLSLIRKAVHESFVYLRKHAWSDDVVSKYASRDGRSLQNAPAYRMCATAFLSPSLRFVAVLEDPGMSNPPKGIRYQLVEVFVPELIKAAPQVGGVVC